MEQGLKAWPLAAMDPSPSDYVARRVDKRLQALPKRHPVNVRFHPEGSRVPPAEGRASVPGLGIPLLEAVDGVLDRLVFPDGTRLNDVQRRAIREGFTPRVHLLQGPPGTGKTQVTTVATLLERTRDLEGAVGQAVEGAGLPWGPLRLLHLDLSKGEHDALSPLPGPGLPP